MSFFKKLGYRFLVESKIEKSTFPYKTALSEGNVKTNRKGSARWTYRKEPCFTSKYFIFFENFISVEEPRKRVDLIYQLPKCPYSDFPKALEFYLKVLFPCEYP